jgi:hypothetical protein
MAGSRSGYQACALIPHRTGAARNGGVMTPFYRVGEGEEREGGMRSPMAQWSTIKAVGYE